MQNSEGDPDGSHLPDYVKKQPWYFQTDSDQIGHQRIAPYAVQKTTALSASRGSGPVEKTAVKWKPGCCKNCGSSSHKESECTERPRRRNARVTGVGVATKDRKIQDDMSWDAKHDQFSGYSAARWRMEVSGTFRHAERVRAAAPKTERQLEIREEYGHTNFRNREDTASYLQGTREDDTSDLWASRSGAPTGESGEGGETLEQRRKMREFRETKNILNKASSGETLIKETVPKSKYGELEDVYTNGHSAVYGSYFCDGKWGYACCRQLGKDCYCTNPR